MSSGMSDDDDEYEYENGKEKGRLSNGKKIMPSISSTLILDYFFNENSNMNEVFETIEFEKVNDLSMRGNCFYKLPNNMGKNLFNLTKINLSFNSLEQLDLCLVALKNLEELIIDNNSLVELPNYLGDLYNLRLISVRANKLVKIPESFGNLVNLEELDFSDNAIKDIDGSWEKLLKLKIINLSCNDLKSPPICVIQGSPNLEILDLSRNHISAFSHAPLSSNLKRFNMNDNPENQQFPGWLLTEKFTKLEELILDKTVFASFNIPTEDLPTSKLRKLSMVQCGLCDTNFEQISQSMINLEYLNIGNNIVKHDANHFWTMPVQNLKDPTRLKELIIKAVGLPAIPEKINTLENLTILNVSQNNLSCLPDEICELRKLEFFNASQNNLYALPEAVGNLTALKILFLESNRLSSLPDSIQSLEHLECLDLYNNEFLEVPTQLNKIPNLKALDIDGNVFKTETIQTANVKYQKAKNLLRSTSNLLLLRSDDPKVLSEVDNDLSGGSLDYEDDRRNDENKSIIDVSLSDIVSEENWSISEDSSDEYDPTAKPKSFRVYSSFDCSSVSHYGNFCPADLHSARIRDQLAALRKVKVTPINIEEGQFDDA